MALAAPLPPIRMPDVRRSDQPPRPAFSRVPVRYLVILLLGGLIPLAAAAFGLDQPMDEASARAMLNRFGFGATPASLAATTGKTPRHYLRVAIETSSRQPASITSQLARLPSSEPVEAIWSRFGPGGTERDNDDRQRLQQMEKRHADAAVQTRLLSMANGDNQGHEALLAFWLNHFSIYAPKNLDKLLAADYARTLESAMSADSFEALLRASFYHPAMQLYLDNAQSTSPSSQAGRLAGERGRALGINENLARELLELHTLGVDGGYRQEDVQELARIITGAGVWQPRMVERNLERSGAVRRGLFLFDARRHDFGEKRLLGQRFPAGEGLEEIDRALHLLALHPATARHLAGKLALRFLDDQPPRALVETMARAYLNSGGRISAMLWPLLGSPDFARSLAQPVKFKEPLDYLLSVTRASCGDEPIANGPWLAATALDLGQAPFMHTTPDGYGARSSDWLSPVAMAKRIRLAMGAASGRLPLAAGAGEIPENQFAGMTPASRPADGRPCLVDDAAVERLVGPPDAATHTAAATLAPRERSALLLAGPTFMRR